MAYILNTKVIQWVSFQGCEGFVNFEKHNANQDFKITLHLEHLH